MIRMRAVVVGGGLAGLSAAIQLAVDGASVLVIESNRTLGGRVRIEDSGDWILDSGLHLMRRRGPFQQLQRRLRAPRVLGKRWDSAKLVGVGCDNRRARDVLSSMRLDAGNVAERAIVPTGGWSSLIDRMITSAKEMGVEFTFETEAKGLLLNGDNKVRAVITNADEIECDCLVLAIPPKPAAKLLESAKLSTTELDACTEQRVAALDAALTGKPMRPYSGYFDERSGVLVIDQSKPDRLPQRGSEDECTLLHAVSLNAEGEEGLNAIKEFLDSHCSGWRNMVAIRRSTKSVMLHPSKLDERVNGRLYINNRIALAGTHVLTPHTLSDASVDSGRKAAKLLMNR